MDARAPLLERTLIIVAHPDDEAVTCAALVQRMREPYLLFCTDGAPLDAYFWNRHGSREAYSLLRQEEARLALSRVGVTNVEFLKTQSGDHITDQQLFQQLPEAIDAVFRVVSRIHPQALLTLAYEGGHPDHDSCNFITSVIARERPLPAWEMPVDHLFHKGERRFQTFMPAPQPWISLHPTAVEIARKRKALETYASQGHFLVRFASVSESFRPMGEYDYARPAARRRAELRSLAVEHDGQAGVCGIRSLSELVRSLETRFSCYSPLSRNTPEGDLLKPSKLQG